MTVFRVCSRCGEPKPLSEYHRDRSVRGGHKARCKACYLEMRRAAYARRRDETPRRLTDKTNMVTMLSCPVDAVLGIPLYLTPCLFSRSSFQETLAAGYWPDESLFEYAIVYRRKPALWRVSGRRLLEVDGERVVVGLMRSDDRIFIRVLD